jgi:MFS family permease
MQTVAQSFLVLDLTNSGTALGLAISARFAPIFLLAPWGGVIADRLDLRRVLFVTQFLSGLLALTFGLLISAHVITMWMVYLLAVLLGTVNVFDSPARQSIISELVPRDQLANAVTLNSITMNLARILGAALGGSITAAIGLAPCFDVNAASFLAVLAGLAMMNREQMFSAARDSPEPGQVRAGLRYVRRSPELLIPLLMISVIGTLAWEFQVSLPLLAHDTFHGSAGTYGTMMAVMGGGAVVGGLVTASRARPRAAALSIAALAWGIAITAAAVAPSLLLELVLLVFVGYGSISFNSLAKTWLQLAAVPIMRGRVMSLWSLAWMGSTLVGGPIVGWVAEQLGARWGLLIGGIPTIAVGLFSYSALSRLGPSPVAEPLATAEPDTTTGEPEADRTSG